MKPARYIFMIAFLLTGCSKPTAVETPLPVTPPITLSEGAMAFELNGISHNIEIFAQSNGYVNGEVVLRGSGPGMENTLMLTFKPILGTRAAINREMTGYWDLGLCIPFNRYLLTSDPTNSITITSYESLLAGSFTLIFQHESDPGKRVIFQDGRFTARVDTQYPFRYCNEG